MSAPCSLGHKFPQSIGRMWNTSPCISSSKKLDSASYASSSKIFIDNVQGIQDSSNWFDKTPFCSRSPKSLKRVGGGIRRRFESVYGRGVIWSTSVTLGSCCGRTRRQWDWSDG
ncbi:hypothetical protein M407DRAFT_245544 [Tulasnella calospora MUT 4182]|uniref:Uncharacterized protein n=1 Tax=Tulasnella calospora MUT 4182 TaxID=1051891 RepID=A0A0C3Q9G1_9AGAM|nr:hypothetical protein M407DRAFT_245544 [Tulasnella calospora MUT 4182]